VPKEVLGLLRCAINSTIEHIRLKDWKLLKLLFLKDFFRVLGFKNKSKRYCKKYYTETSVAHIRKREYNLKIIHRRFDGCKEIYIDKVYFKLPTFSPNPHQIIFDIGANVGEYSLIAGKMVGEGGRIIAVEPNPKSFKILERNITLNSLTNVIPINMAIGSNSGGKIDLYGFEYAPTITTTTKRGDADYSFSADVITIDDIRKKLDVDYVSLLKIDIEGAEFSALSGGEETIKECRPKIIVEIHYRQDREKIINMLSNWGYTIVYERVLKPFSACDYFDFLDLLYLQHKSEFL